MKNISLLLGVACFALVLLVPSAVYASTITSNDFSSTDTRSIPDVKPIKTYPLGTSSLSFDTLIHGFEFTCVVDECVPSFKILQIDAPIDRYTGANNNLPNNILKYGAGCTNQVVSTGPESGSVVPIRDTAACNALEIVDTSRVIKLEMEFLVHDRSRIDASRYFNIEISGDAPTITAPADVTAEATGQFTTVTLVPATVDGATETATHDAPEDGFTVGTHTVTWTLTTFNGLEYTDTQTVTITYDDFVDPTIVAPPNVVAPAAGDLTIVELGDATVTNTDSFIPDLVFSATHDAPAEGFAVGTHDVTWTVLDADGNPVTDGNGNHITATQIVTIAPHDPGTISLGMPDQTLDTSQVAGFNGISMHAFTLYVDGIELSFDTFFEGGLVRTTPEGLNDSPIKYLSYKTTDPDYVDHIGPRPPADAPAVPSAITETVCRVNYPLCSVATDAFPRGSFELTVTAYTADGCSVSTSAQITFSDDPDDATVGDAPTPDTAPATCSAMPEITITAPPNVEQAATGALTTVALGTPTVDGATATTIDNDAPAAGFSVGVHTVTWTITVDGTDYTAIQTVTITRQSGTPTITITAPSAITEEATGALTTVALGTPTVTGATGTPTPINNAPSGGFPVGPTTVTWTVTVGGTDYTATQTVTITDSTGPVITGATDVTADATDSTGTTVTFPTVTATDLVDGDVAVIFTPDATTVFTPGTHTVTISATDSSGNTATPVTFTVTISEPAPDDQIENNDFARPSNTFTSIDRATDALQYVRGDLNSRGGNPYITFNSMYDQFTVNCIEGSPNPNSENAHATLDCQPIITVAQIFAPESSGDILGDTIPTTNQDIVKYESDTCSRDHAGPHFTGRIPPHITQNDAGCNELSIITDRYVKLVLRLAVHDNPDGNPERFFLVEVGDPPSVTITAPDDVTADATGALTTVTLGMPTITGTTQTATSNAPSGGFSVGVHTVTWTVTVDGIPFTATQTVTISGATTPLSITAPDDITITQTGERTPVVLGSATHTGSSSAIVSNNEPSNGFPVGQTIVTWRVTDGTNTATDTQTVTIESGEFTSITSAFSQTTRHDGTEPVHFSKQFDLGTTSISIAELRAGFDVTCVGGDTHCSESFRVSKIFAPTESGDFVLDTAIVDYENTSCTNPTSTVHTGGSGFVQPIRTFAGDACDTLNIIETDQPIKVEMRFTVLDNDNGADTSQEAFFLIETRDPSNIPILQDDRFDGTEAVSAPKSYLAGTSELSFDTLISNIELDCVDTCLHVLKVSNIFEPRESGDLLNNDNIPTGFRDIVTYERNSCGVSSFGSNHANHDGSFAQQIVNSNPDCDRLIIVDQDEYIKLELQYVLWDEKNPPTINYFLIGIGEPPVSPVDPVDPPVDPVDPLDPSDGMISIAVPDQTVNIEAAYYFSGFTLGDFTIVVDGNELNYGTLLDDNDRYVTPTNPGQIEYVAFEPIDSALLDALGVVNEHDDVETLHPDIPELVCGVFNPDCNVSTDLVETGTFEITVTGYTADGCSVSTTASITIEQGPSYDFLDTIPETASISVGDIPEPATAPDTCPKGGGGNDDSEWEKKPTFGKNYASDAQLVECGYSMDGMCNDVLEYHVDYQRQIIYTNSSHDFALKAYTPGTLQSMLIAFSIPNIGTPIIDAEAVIDVQLERDFSETLAYTVKNVNILDTHNTIDYDPDNTTVSIVDCMPGVDTQCIQVGLNGVLFREQFHSEPFLISAVDTDRRNISHYMNEGILIQGESLNLPPQATAGIYKPGSQYDAISIELVRVDKLADLWEDQFGNIWTKNDVNTWEQLTFAEYTPRQDSSVNVMTRQHSAYSGMVQYEQERAMSIFNSGSIQNDIKESFSYNMVQITQDDISEKLALEDKRAQELLKLHTSYK